MKRKKADPDGEVKTWAKTPTPCLIKYVPAGTYYLRARFGDGPVRESLDTTDYTTAKLKLAARLEQLRGATGRRDFDTPSAALAFLVERTKTDPSVMESTRESYLWSLAALGVGKGAALPSRPFLEISPQDMGQWWAKAAKDYAPQQANHLLRWAKECFALAHLRHNPTSDLRRVKITRKRRALLSLEQLRALLAKIREHHQGAALADWLEFAAYSGLRPGEQLGVCWAHVELEKGRILVTEGKTVNQTGKTRFVPIIAPMTELLARLPRTGEKLFPRAQRPRSDGLRQACRKLGLPMQRVYDFRHLFATVAIKAGVDVPTVSRWLGHGDGGALVMRTYIHPGEEHSMEAAKKVTF